MHELSLCQALVSLLEQQAAEQSFVRVRQIWLEVGALAAVAPEAMMLAFAAASRATLAEGAILHLLERPGRARCGDCGRECEIRQWQALCPACGHPTLQLLSGQQIMIRELEVE